VTRALFTAAALALALTATAAGRVHAQHVDAPRAAASSAVSRGLEPGDLVRLKIWREADLSGDYRVDERGMAVFPKIGTIPVTSMSTDSLQSLLVSAYARYLQSPSIEVTFLRRVDIVGEVKNPGLYHVDPTMTLPDVLALAGGVTSEADARRIELIRRGSRATSHLSQGVSLADSTLRSGDQLRVPQRSWMSRNAAAVLAAGITASALVLAAFIRP